MISILNDHNIAVLIILSSPNSVKQCFNICKKLFDIVKKVMQRLLVLRVYVCTCVAAISLSINTLPMAKKRLVFCSQDYSKLRLCSYLKGKMRHSIYRFGFSLFRSCYSRPGYPFGSRFTFLKCDNEKMTVVIFYVMDQNNRWAN